MVFFIIPQPEFKLLWKDISQQFTEGMKKITVRARPVSNSTRRTTSNICHQMLLKIRSVLPKYRGFQHETLSFYQDLAMKKK